MVILRSVVVDSLLDVDPPTRSILESDTKVRFLANSLSPVHAS
jgi:hypothetical protein